MSEKLPYPEILPVLLRTWLTSDVMGVAKSIHKELAFERLPILADALADAGCEDDAIIGHLRGEWRTCFCCDGEKTETLYVTGRVVPCHLCLGVGRLREDQWHKYSYGKTGGCWERSCWLVNHILGETQPLRGKYETNDHEWHTGTAINPGEWFGQVWVLQTADCYDPPMYFIEATYVDDAEDIYIESEWGEHDRILDEDLPDYVSHHRQSEGDHDEYRCAFTGNGIPYDSENIHVGRTMECLYYGPGLPALGVHPTGYANPVTCRVCSQVFYPPRIGEWRDRPRRLHVFPSDELCSVECRAVAEESDLAEHELAAD